MGRRKKVEDWEAIKDFNGDFEISRSGLVRRNNVKETVKTGTAILVKNVGSVLIPRCQISKGIYTCKYKGHNVSIDIKETYSELFPNEVNPFIKKTGLKKALVDYVKKAKECSVIKSFTNPFSEALYSILDAWNDLSTIDVKKRLKKVAESSCGEVWKPVKGVEDKYFVSNMGKMKSVINGKEKLVGAKCGWTKTPYITYYVNGQKINIQVAKVILKTFTGIDGKKVRFKDNDPTNLRLDNLEWIK